MIKGINKSVIEIVDTGNEMFERAILFLRPHCQDGDDEHINRMAHGFLGNLRIRRRWFSRLRIGWTLLRYGFAVGLGAALAALFLTVF